MAGLSRGKEMNTFWQKWLDCWCIAVGLFGALVAGVGFASTDLGGRAWLHVIGNYDLLDPDRGMRFGIGILGAVTFGWAASLFVAFRATHKLSGDQGPIWRAYAGALLLWCVLDSSISIHNGFTVNAVTNTLFLAGFILPLMRAGYLSR